MTNFKTNFFSIHRMLNYLSYVMIEMRNNFENIL